MMATMSTTEVRGQRRRRLGTMKQESVSVPRELRARVTEIAERYHVSRGLLMRFVIERGLPGAVRELQRPRLYRSSAPAPPAEPLGAGRAMGTGCRP